jgi:hypothetical protein
VSATTRSRVWSVIHFRRAETDTLQFDLVAIFVPLFWSQRFQAWPLG